MTVLTLTVTATMLGSIMLGAWVGFMATLRSWSQILAGYLALSCITGLAAEVAVVSFRAADIAPEAFWYVLVPAVFMGIVGYAMTHPARTTCHGDHSRFEVVLGVTPGYGHNNEDYDEDVLTRVGLAWTQEAERLYLVGCPYVTAIVQHAVAWYPPEKGCPDEGEHVVIVSGSCHQQDLVAWQRTVHRLAATMRKRFEQRTVRVTFCAAEVARLTGP